MLNFIYFFLLIYLATRAEPQRTHSGNILCCICQANKNLTPFPFSNYNRNYIILIQYSNAIKLMPENYSFARQSKNALIRAGYVFLLHSIPGACHFSCRFM